MYRMDFLLWEVEASHLTSDSVLGEEVTLSTLLCDVKSVLPQDGGSTSRAIIDCRLSINRLFVLTSSSNFSSANSVFCVMIF